MLVQPANAGEKQCPVQVEAAMLGNDPRCIDISGSCPFF